MALSIFNIPNWTDQPIGTVYDQHDIIKYNKFYYYSKIRQSKGSAIFDSTNWDGVISYNGKNRPYFFWSPSYNSRINIKPDVREIRFGDGFSQVSPSSINPILLPFNLNFAKRSDMETRAILHFLNVRAGSQSFVFTPPPPYNINKLFISQNWSHVIQFVDNNLIECEFTESVI